MTLTEPKWEAFAYWVASGQSKRNAAIAAGYGAKDASSRASKLARKPEIARRIVELQHILVNNRQLDPLTARIDAMDRRITPLLSEIIARLECLKIR